MNERTGTDGDEQCTQPVVVFVMILDSSLSPRRRLCRGKTLIAYRALTVLFSHALVIRPHMARLAKSREFFFVRDRDIDIAGVVVLLPAVAAAVVAATAAAAAIAVATTTTTTTAAKQFVFVVYRMACNSVQASQRTSNNDKISERERTSI